MELPSSSPTSLTINAPPLRLQPPTLMPILRLLPVAPKLGMVPLISQEMSEVSNSPSLPLLMHPEPPSLKLWALPLPSPSLHQACTDERTFLSTSHKGSNLSTVYIKVNFK